MKTSNVKLRRKKLADNKRESLYLDYYPPILNQQTGSFTRREFLGMYVPINPKNELEKNQKKTTLLRAQIVLNDRQNKIYNNDFGFLTSEIENKSFLDYFEKTAIKRGSSSSNLATWLIVLKYLKEFSPQLKMKDITVPIAEKFRIFLLEKKHFRGTKLISQNTACSYFSKFIYAIKSAHKDNLLKENIAPKIERIKTLDTKREFLTKEEIKKLIATPCKNEQQKNICLFMIYTGLRVSDVLNLRWDNIEYSEEEGYSIRFQHKKTKTQQTLPFNSDAFKLLGNRGDNNQVIFEGFVKDYRILKQWSKDAGINKNIGFHTFRHTFATLLINSGVGVYTVMTMLGHKDLKNTMTYINLLDEKKTSAANSINF